MIEAAPPEPPPAICVRWRWTSDKLEVWCLKWVKK
jgi:hypothetical protein